MRASFTSKAPKKKEPYPKIMGIWSIVLGPDTKVMGMWSIMLGTLQVQVLCEMEPVFGGL